MTKWLGVLVLVAAAGCDSSDDGDDASGRSMGDSGSGNELDASMAAVDGGAADASPAPSIYDSCNWSAEVVADKAIADDILLRLNIANYKGDNAWHSVFEVASDLRELFADAPHDGPVQVYQNMVSHDAVRLWGHEGRPLPYEAPDGSIFVMEHWADEADGDPVMTGRSIMKKDATLDEAKYPGQWFYIDSTPDFVPVYDCDEGTLEAGSLETCVSCHNGETNYGLFPSAGDPMMAAPEGADALVPYDYIVAAYCDDPVNACD